MNSRLFIGFTSALLFLLSFNVSSQNSKSLEGRWDLVINKDGKELPSWLEIRHSGRSTLVGSFVYSMGSARPIAEVKINDGVFSFAIPPQWEEGSSYLEFQGSKVGDGLVGTMLYTNGKKYNWTASRAPDLDNIKNPIWGAPIAIFNGKDLSGWHSDGPNQWFAEDGILKNPKSGANLITDNTYKDFKLHVEFRYPEGSNSGIYLRGRYEIQINDSKDSPPSNILFGGLYGFLCPNEMAAKSAGEWQSFDITLIGRRISIVANGISIITDQIIPGITGGALDSREGEPGPFFIQGDHGAIELRNIVVTPLME